MRAKRRPALSPPSRHTASDYRIRRAPLEAMLTRLGDDEYLASARVHLGLAWLAATFAFPTRARRHLDLVDRRALAEAADIALRFHNVSAFVAMTLGDLATFRREHEAWLTAAKATGSLQKIARCLHEWRDVLLVFRACTRKPKKASIAPSPLRVKGTVRTMRRARMHSRRCVISCAATSNSRVPSWIGCPRRARIASTSPSPPPGELSSARRLAMMH